MLAPELVIWTLSRDCGSVMAALLCEACMNGKLGTLSGEQLNLPEQLAVHRLQACLHVRRELPKTCSPERLDVVLIFVVAVVSEGGHTSPTPIANRVSDLAGTLHQRHGILGTIGPQTGITQ